jgi:hypothetical protein
MPSPTCLTGQGGFPQGDAASSASKRSREKLALLGLTDGGFSIWSGAPKRSGNLRPTCQPVRIAELAKMEIYNARDYRASSACR